MKTKQIFGLRQPSFEAPALTSSSYPSASTSHQQSSSTTAFGNNTSPHGVLATTARSVPRHHPESTNDIGSPCASTLLRPSPGRLIDQRSIQSSAPNIFPEPSSSSSPPKHVLPQLRPTRLLIHITDIFEHKNTAELVSIRAPPSSVHLAASILAPSASREIAMGRAKVWAVMYGLGETGSNETTIEDGRFVGLEEEHQLSIFGVKRMERREMRTSSRGER